MIFFRIHKSCQFIFLFLLFSSISPSLHAQPEMMAWGNITGIRVEGQLMEFESSLRVVAKDWLWLTATGKERQQPRFSRQGKTQTVNTSIDGISFSKSVEETGPGSAVISIKTNSSVDTLVEGVFVCFELPARLYAGATAQFSGTSTKVRNEKLAEIPVKKTGGPGDISAKAVVIESPLCRLSLSWNEERKVLVRKKDPQGGFDLYIQLLGPEVKKGMENRADFALTVSGNIDHSPAEIVLETGNPGRLFAGLGGNFRLQNPRSDPEVIDWCLDSIRVTWGRVEMPWSLWQPEENIDPADAALNGNLNAHVKESMEMAKRLVRMGIPVIVSDWQAPAWAILGSPADAWRNRSKGIYGYQLNPEKTEKIYQSIAAYLLYLKKNYGVEAAFFSFNESDLGINVRHTGEEHAAFIKGFGAHMASRGLATRMLLGDNSDATTFDFILPALNDPETHKYIGAVSFHSWRGCDDATLKKWAGAARELNVPLIVAEGSTDAAAHSYPAIFLESSFAFYEINLYTRLCALCEPLSILQWQLTSDYSVLTGKGIYRTSGPLRPTQRYWNLKQFASVPANSFALPVKCSNENVNCAAFGNIAGGSYALHMVNNGASRLANISGFPGEVKELLMYLTDADHGMVPAGILPVKDGMVTAELPPACFVTLISKK
ncbi:MAG: hypothetical protein U0T82_06115 [Bacteroidales bacterium]